MDSIAHVLATQDPFERLAANIQAVGTGTRRHWALRLQEEPAGSRPAATGSGIASGWITLNRWYAVVNGHLTNVDPGLQAVLARPTGDVPHGDWLAVLSELPKKVQRDTVHAVAKRNWRGLMEPFVAARADRRAVQFSLHQLAMPRLRPLPSNETERNRGLWLSTDMALLERPKIAMLPNDPYVQAHGPMTTEQQGATIVRDSREQLEFSFDAEFQGWIDNTLAEYRDAHQAAGVAVARSALLASVLSPLLRSKFDLFSASAARTAADLPTRPDQQPARALIAHGQAVTGTIQETADHFTQLDPLYEAAIRLEEVRSRAAPQARCQLPTRACCGSSVNRNPNGTPDVCIDCGAVPREGEIAEARLAKLNQKGLIPGETPRRHRPSSRRVGG